MWDTPHEFSHLILINLLKRYWHPILNMKLISWEINWLVQIHTVNKWLLILNLKSLSFSPCCSTSDLELFPNIITAYIITQGWKLQNALLKNSTWNIHSQTLKSSSQKLNFFPSFLKLKLQCCFQNKCNTYGVNQ